MHVFMNAFVCVCVMYHKLLYQMFTYVGAQKVLVPQMLEFAFALALIYETFKLQ